MDRNPREGPKCAERRSREASRVERLMEGGMELVLHARRINVPSRTDILRENEKWNCTPEIRLAGLIFIHKIQ